MNHYIGGPPPPEENFQSACILRSVPTKSHGEYRRFVGSFTVPHTWSTVLSRIVREGKVLICVYITDIFLILQNKLPSYHLRHLTTIKISYMFDNGQYKSCNSSAK